MTAAPTAPAAPPTGTWSTPLLLVALGGAALAVGSLLPWTTGLDVVFRCTEPTRPETCVPDHTILAGSGFDGGGGFITLVGGAILAILAIVAITRRTGLGRWLGIGMLTVAALLLVVMHVNYQEARGEVGAGIWVMFGGVAAALVGSLMSLSESRFLASLLVVLLALGAVGSMVGSAIGAGFSGDDHSDPTTGVIVVGVVALISLWLIRRRRPRQLPPSEGTRLG